MDRSAVTCIFSAFESGTRPRTAPSLCYAAKGGPKRARQRHPPSRSARRRVPSTAQMFRGRSKTRLRLRQFARLLPETSTPFRWLCTGSLRPIPTQKQGKVVRPRCNDLRFSSRLPMPEPDVHRPKKAAQLFEPQASFERSGRGAAGGGDPLSGFWTTGIGIGHRGGPGGPG